MKRLLLFLFASVFIFGLSAQSWIDMSESDLMTKALGKYVAANTTKINSRASACNKGTEPFIDFITKFRTNKTFRKSRIKLNEGDQYWNGELESWSCLKAGKGTDRKYQCKYFNTWYNITADQVCLESQEEPLDPDSEWGGSSLFFRFKRIAGKWYLTGAVICG